MTFMNPEDNQNPAQAGNRPVILSVLDNLTYEASAVVQIKLTGFQVQLKDLKVTMYPANTQGGSMNQKPIDLQLKEVQSNDNLGIHNIVVATPASCTIAPPGDYMLSVVFQGVSSVAKKTCAIDTRD
ncbi:hypothetical protein GH714_024823 [Hevea brasiliensis]|uniref:Galactose oxidase-like Early set domain-containing protein n=1 Tax=Hevea brasiliensis TaxID=3981 RepID=A0A6A6LSE7_HEVBR|nr:hypothetical protein GH714_024823 [Hevea brasiliensis]